MAKNQSTRQVEHDGPSGGEAASVGRHGLDPIQPPAAPAVIHSEEVGAHVAQDQAIREKVRLYPQASVQEIVAMFELEGLKVSPEAVRKITAGGQETR
ncbi:MAG TPA: hypothetical protein VG826_04425 [Pirellulales bacterium]|nr:hypothetical protein [Pirellulales bacterium]